MTFQLTAGRFRAETDAGLPLVGGMLYTYASGTNSYKAAYTDATLTTPATHPVVLNARGEAQVWLGAGAYSLKLTASGGHRTMDMFHVATAIHLGAQKSLTFDDSQRRPADFAGLEVAG